MCLGGQVDAKGVVQSASDKLGAKGVECRGVWRVSPWWTRPEADRERQTRMDIALGEDERGMGR